MYTCPYIYIYIYKYIRVHLYIYIKADICSFNIDIPTLLSALLSSILVCAFLNSYARGLINGRSSASDDFSTANGDYRHSTAPETAALRAASRPDVLALSWLHR